MRKPPRKKTDWKLLVTLARRYDDDGKPVPGPAVQVTYSHTDGLHYFSHTPGIIVDGTFRAVQHLHDRHAEVYVLLLADAMMAVTAAKRSGMEHVEADIDLFRMAMRDAQTTHRTLEQVDRAARAVVDQKRSRGRSEPQKRGPDKPTLKVSLGDMVKAKANPD